MSDYALHRAANLIHAAATELWGATTNVTPGGEARRKLMKAVEVGQMVFISSEGNGRRGIDCVGRLKRIEMLPCSDDEDGEEDDEPPPEFLHWTIETLDGREFTWTNVQPLRIPERAYQWGPIQLYERRR